jgi:hypothetical protein
MRFGVLQNGTYAERAYAESMRSKPQVANAKIFVCIVSTQKPSSLAMPMQRWGYPFYTNCGSPRT